MRNYNLKQSHWAQRVSPRALCSAARLHSASQMQTPEHKLLVLFHEALGHMGLRGVFGTSLNRVLNQVMVARRAEVLAKVREYGRNANSPEHMLQAAEEVLASMAQTRGLMGMTLLTLNPSFTHHWRYTTMSTLLTSSQALGDSLIQRVMSLMETPYDKLAESYAAEKLELGARRCREALSSTRWYARGAERAAARGQEPNYWKGLWSSHCNMVHPPVQSSTAEAVQPPPAQTA
jgi:hypothetical protein